MGRDIADQLVKYLTDAHAIEMQSLSQLRTAPEIAGEGTFSHELREHYGETEEHEARIRGLLEERGGKPSRLKDAVMAAGGKAFTAFARSQADSAGKLASHALSYEALEWASYDLLARVADRAGDQYAAETAREIRDEERTMMSRIEALFDRTVDASLEQVHGDDLDRHLRHYLADAHAIEAQSIQLLGAAIPMVGDYPVLRDLFERHLDESRAQQALIEDRLEALNGKRSLLKDAALRMGALNWGLFFLGQPDTPGKLTAFAYAFEHLEIGGYEQLRRVAERADETGTVEAVTRILEEERSTAEKLAAAFDVAADAALEAAGVEGLAGKRAPRRPTPRPPSGRRSTAPARRGGAGTR